MNDSIDVKKIQKHCATAMFLVGIIPVRSVQIRSHRNLLKHEMNLEELLKTYFNSHESLQKRAESLTEKALKLDELLPDEEQDELNSENQF